MTNDLISRAALLDSMGERYEDLREKYGYYDHFTDGYEDAMLKVEDAPAVDAVPVVLGEWIGIDSSFWKPTHRGDVPVFRKSFRCSKCRRKTVIAENFCPNCGAAMNDEALEIIKKRNGERKEDKQ